jgi:hypothetical protein
LYNCKTNAQQQQKCTTAKQIYCNTNPEVLTGCSTWEIIILLLFSLAFQGYGGSGIVIPVKKTPQEQKKQESRGFLQELPT